MTTITEREQARIKLQERLDAGKSQTERNRLGQFATPTMLASQIVSYSLALLSPRSKIHFLEPAFGTGAFYSALLHHAPPGRIEAAAAYEIDPHYGEEAKRLWQDTGLSMQVDDFTKALPPRSESARYNLVICNPPYVRHHHLSQTQKRELQAAVARYLNIEMKGLSGFYTYFMLLSQAWMAKDCDGAGLIPSEFMDVNYGRKVKQFLLEKVTLHRIHRFDPNEVQFADALVSSAVVFFKNLLPVDEHEAEFTFGGTLSRPKVSEFVKLKDLRHISKWTSLPQGIGRPLRSQNSSTLADLFSIKRGVATGCNGFFVLTPQEVRQLNLPQEFLKPILPSPRELDTDEIAADEHGEPRIVARRYLLSCDLLESEVESRYPALWRYLQQGMQEGVHQRYLCRHREPWYSQEKRAVAPFLCTYMGRPTQRSESPFRFILNRSEAIAANVYLMLYPKPVLRVRLGDDPQLYTAAWKGLSSITAAMLIGEGRVYGGGLHKLEPKELGSVPAEIVLNALPGGGELTLHRQLELFAR